MTASVLKQDPETKIMSPKIYILCVRVTINKRYFEPFCVCNLLIHVVSMIMIVRSV